MTDEACVMDVHVIKKCAIWFLAHQVSMTSLQNAHERSHECPSHMTMHNNQTTSQTIHFEHNNSIIWAKAILARIQTRCDQLSGPQTGMIIPVDFYIAGTQASSPASNPAIQYPREVRNRLD